MVSNICLNVLLSILSLSLSLCLSVYLSICLSNYLSLCLSVSLSLCISMSLSVSIVLSCLTRFLEQRRHKLHSLGPEPDQDIGVSLKDGFDCRDVQEVDEIALRQLKVDLVNKIVGF